MKAPNGFGSIDHMKGNRRKPYRVRITTGYDMDETGTVRQAQRTLGFYATYEEAVEALAAYNRNPIALEPGVTFAEVFRRWSAEKFPTVSKSTVKSYQAAFNAMPMLHNMEFRKLRRADLQHAVDTCGKAYPMLEIIAVVIRGLYQYAMQNDLLDRDYSRYLDISRHKPDAPTPPIHKAFTEAEVAAVWTKAEEDATARDTIVMIYSGLRISEFLALRADDIDLDARFITIRAAKTAAGVRRVPIAAKTASFWTAIRAERETQPELSAQRRYDLFSANLTGLCSALRIPDHRPHDTRHTTATLLRLAGVDPLITKMILGHSSRDLTERVYTHLPDAALLDAIDRL